MTHCLKDIKHGNIDYNDELSSDHLLYGTHRLHEMESLLYYPMISHGVIPTEKNAASLMPIPKKKKTNK